jgi:hypothetical protein
VLILFQQNVCPLIKYVRLFLLSKNSRLCAKLFQKNYPVCRFLALFVFKAGVATETLK